MHRAELLALLERYLDLFPEDLLRVDHVRQFVRVHPNCFERDCSEGHITGSAWILSADLEHVLLSHHRKLDRWLQLGGHADGDTDTRRVARREAAEESGMTEFETPAGCDPSLPFDVDVHVIPARGREPAHLHHDLRYLLVALPGQELRLSEESRELRWVPRRRLRDLVDEEGILRMERKATELLAKSARTGSGGSPACNPGSGRPVAGAARTR